MSLGAAHDFGWDFLLDPFDLDFFLLQSIIVENWSLKHVQFQSREGNLKVVIFAYSRSAPSTHVRFFARPFFFVNKMSKLSWTLCYIRFVSYITKKSSTEHII